MRDLMTHKELEERSDRVARKISKGIRKVLIKETGCPNISIHTLMKSLELVNICQYMGDSNGVNSTQDFTGKKNKYLKLNEVFKEVE